MEFYDGKIDRYVRKNVWRELTPFQKGMKKDMNEHPEEVEFDEDELWDKLQEAKEKRKEDLK